MKRTFEAALMNRRSYYNISNESPVQDDEIIRIIHEAGFDAVDFNIDHCMSCESIVNGICESKMDEPLETLIQKALDIKAIADKYNVSFYQAHAPFPCYVTEPSNGYNDYLLDVLKKTIAGCAYIGCTRLIVRPFFLGYNE